MRSEKEAVRAIELYADMVRRICMVHLKSYSDTEDIFQNVFLKYALSSAVFESAEHEKAWLIRVTINECRDLLKSVFRSRTVCLDELAELPADEREDNRQVLEAVLALPEKYRDAVYLFYYEGYSCAEIGELLGQKTNTVYTRLDRARGLLREKLGGEEFGR